MPRIIKYIAIHEAPLKKESGNQFTIEDVGRNSGTNHRNLRTRRYNL